MPSGEGTNKDSRCSYQNKVRYRSYGTAMRRLRYEQRCLGYGTCAVYKCQYCGCWHITSERRRSDHRPEGYNRNKEKRKWSKKWH